MTQRGSGSALEIEVAGGRVANKNEVERQHDADQESHAGGEGAAQIERLSNGVRSAAARPQSVLRQIPAALQAITIAIMLVDAHGISWPHCAQKMHLHSGIRPSFADRQGRAASMSNMAEVTACDHAYSAGRIQPSVQNATHCNGSAC